MVHRLQSRDCAPVEILEQDYVKRLFGARGGSDVVVDLLFASSGIENVVADLGTLIAEAET